MRLIERRALGAAEARDIIRRAIPVLPVIDARRVTQGQTVGPATGRRRR
jgi:hypothetical protein